MYLTRFRMNAARADARRLLASPQRLHAAVMSSFPDSLPGDVPTPGAPRVLWRMDRIAAANVQVFISSPSRPDLTHLVEQAGWPATATADSPGWQTFDYGRFLDQVSKGSTWQFRLTANPVHWVATEAAKPDQDGRVEKKRTAHLTREHQLRWLLDREETGGFHILEKPKDRQQTEHGDERQVVVRDRHPMRFARGKGRVTIMAVTYEGRLEVTDPEVLRRTLTQGLGKAKAYGCGLMTLAPVQA